MREESVDPEVLAALLDGKLTEVERDAVLERLASSPEDFAVFAEAAAVAAELELCSNGFAEIEEDRPKLVVETGGAARVEPQKKPWYRREWSARALVPIAAVLAGVAVLPLMRLGQSPLGQLAGTSLVASPGDSSLTVALGPNWDQPGWSVTRGGGGETLLGRRREFRAGIRLVDVEVAYDANDMKAARTMVSDLVAVLGQMEASGPVVAEYTRATQPDGARAFVNDREQAAKHLVAFIGDSPWFDLGVWTEQARLSALRKYTAFFNGRAANRLNDVTERIAASRAETAAALVDLQRLEAMIRDRGELVDLAEVQAVLATVIRENGG